MGQVAFRALHGILISENSGFDYVESQARLEKFQKDTGVGVQDAGNLYSLGMVSRSDACVAFMTAEYINVTENGKAERKRCVSVIGYVRLKKKSCSWRRG